MFGSSPKARVNSRQKVSGCPPTGQPVQKTTPAGRTFRHHWLTADVGHEWATSTVGTFTYRKDQKKTSPGGLFATLTGAVSTPVGFLPRQRKHYTTAPRRPNISARRRDCETIVLGRIHRPCARDPPPPIFQPLKLLTLEEQSAEIVGTNRGFAFALHTGGEFEQAQKEARAREPRMQEKPPS